MISTSYIFGRKYNTLDADAQAFITATAITDSTIINAINNLVISLKSNSLWNRIYFLYPMVGGTSTTHSYNLRNVLNYQLTFSGGWTHSSGGALPNGIDGSAETLFTPFGTVGQNNFGMSFYSRTNNTSTNLKAIMGCAGTNSSASVIHSLGATNAYWALNDFAFPLVSTSGSLGLITHNRTGTSTCNYWRNTSKTNVNIASTNVPNRTMVIGCNKGAGGALQQFSSYQCGLASAQEGFTDTEINNYYTIVQAFQTALGRNV